MIDHWNFRYVFEKDSNNDKVEHSIQNFLARSLNSQNYFCVAICLNLVQIIEEDYRANSWKFGRLMYSSAGDNWQQL